MILAFLAAAVASPDCYKLKDTLAKDECLLKETMLDPAPKCSKQMTQYDMNVCGFRDLLRSDIELNRAWEKAVSSAKESDRLSRERHFGPTKEFSRLLDSQRKWSTFRDAQCLVEAGMRDDGGSMWAMNQNWCMKKLTDARIVQLREYAEPKN